MSLLSARLGPVATAAACALALLPSSAPAANDTVRINPSTLSRGAEVAVPHVVGTTVVDGDRRIPVDAEHLELLGKTGSSYVVVTSDDGGASSVQRLSSSGDLTALVSGAAAWNTYLSDDGRLLVTAAGTRKRTVLTLRDATTGSELRRKRFRGYVDLVDAGDDTLVLSTWSTPRTFTYDVATGTVRTLLRHASGLADLAADRLTYYTADPYDGGCMVVTKVSDPRTRLWRSCEERVAAISPDGRRIATIDLLSDGAGPSAVTARRVRGKALASYRSYVFGEIYWEDGDSLVLGASNRKQWALVRCDGTDCERASDLSATQAPRLAREPRARLP